MMAASEQRAAGAWGVGRWALWLIPVLVPLSFARFELRSGQLFQFTNDPIDLVNLLVLELLVLVAAGAWAVGLPKAGRIRLDVVDALFGAAIVAMGISALLSISPRTSVVGSYGRYDGVATALLLYVLFFLTRQLITDAASARRLADSMMLGTLVVSLYAILQYVGLDPLRWSDVNWGAGRTFSTLGNPDMLGGYLIFGAAVAWAVALGGASGARRHLSWLTAIAASVAVVTTFTRGAWLGFVVAVAIVAVLSLLRGGRLGRVSIIYLAVASMLVGAVIVVSAWATSTVGNSLTRVSSAISGQDTSVNERLLFWQAAARASLARPLFGYGPGTFRLLFQMFRPDAFPTTVLSRPFPDNAHGFIPQTAATDGLIVLALVLGVVGVVMVRSAGRVFVRKPSAEMPTGGLSDVMIGVWAAVAGYCVYLLSGIAAVSALASCLLCLGLLSAGGLRYTEVGSRLTLAGAATACTLAGLLLGLGASSTVADASLYAARTASDERAAYAAAGRSALVGYFEPQYRSERLNLDEAEVRELWLQDQKDRAAGSADASGELRVAVVVAAQDFESYLRQEPYDTGTAAKLANLYNLAGGSVSTSYYTLAAATASQALAIAPNDPLLHLTLAIADAGSGQSKTAVAEFERVVAQDPSYEPGWSLLAVVRLKTGDSAGARDALSHALQLDPNDAQARSVLGRLETSRTKQ